MDKDLGTYVSNTQDRQAVWEILDWKERMGILPCFCLNVIHLQVHNTYGQLFFAHLHPHQGP